MFGYAEIYRCRGVEVCVCVCVCVCVSVYCKELKFFIEYNNLYTEMNIYNLYVFIECIFY